MKAIQRITRLARAKKGIKPISALPTFAVAACLALLAPPAFACQSDSGVSNRPQGSNLLLLGTVVRDEPQVALAIIQLGNNGEQQLYRLDDVVNGGRLVSIQSDGVTLAYADVEVVLDLDGGFTKSVISSATPVATSDGINRIHPPLDRSEDGYWLLDQATAKQLERSELNSQLSSMGASGMRITSINPDGPLQKLGLQKGDVIQSVNGKVPGVDASLPQAVAQPISDEPVLQLMVDRRGHMDLLYYRIDP